MFLKNLFLSSSLFFSRFSIYLPKHLPQINLLLFFMRLIRIIMMSKNLSAH